MKAYTKLYLSAMGYDEGDFVPCECCGKRAESTHHIKCRGAGGSKDKDTIENLMAMCMSCHNHYGDQKRYMDFLRDIHRNRMEGRGIKQTA